jgi:hypothetical protein
VSTDCKIWLQISYLFLQFFYFLDFNTVCDTHEAKLFELNKSNSTLGLLNVCYK